MISKQDIATSFIREIPVHVFRLRRTVAVYGNTVTTVRCCLPVSFIFIIFCNCPKFFAAVLKPSHYGFKYYEIFEETITKEIQISLSNEWIVIFNMQSIHID